MQINWPLVVAVTLVLLKQLYKLFLHHKPDKIDYLKAVATLPLDVSFLVVGLFIKAAMQPRPSSDILFGLMFIYLIISLFSTILWRVSDSSIKNKLGNHFLWAFPLNAALTGSTFYIATQFVK